MHTDSTVMILWMASSQSVFSRSSKYLIGKISKGVVRDRKGENGKLGKTSRIDQVTQAMHSGGDTRKQSHGGIGVPREDGGELVSAVRTGGRASDKRRGRVIFFKISLNLTYSRWTSSLPSCL